MPRIAIIKLPGVWSKRRVSGSTTLYACFDTEAHKTLKPMDRQFYTQEGTKTKKWVEVTLEDGSKQVIKEVHDARPESVRHIFPAKFMDREWIYAGMVKA